MKLIEQFKETILKHQLWSKEAKVLVAVSGGVDSIVLLDLLHHLPTACRPSEVGIAHVNHHTRPETEQEERAIRALAKQYGYPIYVKQWQQGAHVHKNFEQAARAVRYEFFTSVMQSEGYTHLLTAHHQNDQAETVMMKLIRGGLLEEKRGMLLQREFNGGQLVRPLLGIPKQELYRYAAEHQLVYFEDASNQENDYARNRMRNQILPQLEVENSRASEHIADFSEELTGLLEVVAPMIEQLKAECVSTVDRGIQIQLDKLQKQPLALQKLLISECLKELYNQGEGFKKEYVEQIMALAKSDHPNLTIDLKANWQASRRYQNLYLLQQTPNVEVVEESLTLNLGQWVQLSDSEQLGVFEVGQVTPLKPEDKVIAVEQAHVQSPFTVRHRQNGDRMSYKGGEGTKKLKDIFINKKVPLAERDLAWVVEDNTGNILWLIHYQECQLSNDRITDKINYIFVYRQLI